LTAGKEKSQWKSSGESTVPQVFSEGQRISVLSDSILPGFQVLDGIFCYVLGSGMWQFRYFFPLPQKQGASGSLDTGGSATFGSNPSTFLLAVWQPKR
jgi:hypothetical protein